MKILKELCVPRKEIFDTNLSEEVWDLTVLSKDNINPKDFFEKTYITYGMETLLKNAFKRFKGDSSGRGVIKLTQAMGGGKTHNMIAVGLLAKYPEYRTMVFGKEYQDYGLGKVRVVTFTGRNSDAKYGVWGEIAEQLGKKDFLNDYYSPLKAPGENTWVELLKGTPVLILIDELPAYMENASSIQIGNSDLSVVTATAITNLFSAIQKSELNNVCLVISDLNASYENGSALIRGAFKNLEKECGRVSLNLEPVSSNNDEIYSILRKRLFSKLPDKIEIEEVASAYRDRVDELNKIGISSLSSEKIYSDILSSYPFHPSIKDLFSRFRENEIFQQTRGLIRLMKEIVINIYENNLYDKQYLINSYDFDLNKQTTREEFINNIKPSLKDAINHDISANKGSVAEILDKSNESSIRYVDISKLILVSSLSDIPNGIIGLNEIELITLLSSPDKKLQGIKEFLDTYTQHAWYLHKNKKGDYFFKEEKNLIAVIIDYASHYQDEIAKIELKNFMETKFKPVDKSAYQKFLLLPAIDEIEILRDEVTLVVYQPTENKPLSEELNEYYETINYKNRIIFLTGSNKDYFRMLMDNAKYKKAISSVIQEFRQNNISEDDVNLMRAKELYDSAELKLLSSIQETFQRLVYPSKNGLKDSEFRMQFYQNNFNGEQEIINALSIVRKLMDFSSKSEDSIKSLIEQRLFIYNQEEGIVKPTPWNDILRNASVQSGFAFYNPTQLQIFKQKMLDKDLWREENGYVEVGTFKKKTALRIEQIEENGREFLKLTPINCVKPVIYYENGEKTVDRDSNKITAFTIIPTATKMSFLCIDGSGENEIGDIVVWKAEVTLQWNRIMKEDKTYIELTSNIKGDIFFNNDGKSLDYNKYLYTQLIQVDKNMNTIYAQLIEDDVKSNLIIIHKEEVFMDNNTLYIEDKKPLALQKHQSIDNTSTVYNLISKLKKYNVKVSEVILEFTSNTNYNNFVEFTLKGIDIDGIKMEQFIENIRNTLFIEDKTNVTLKFGKLKFEKGEDFKEFNEEFALPNNKFIRTDIKQ